jgi:LysM repeat protein
MSPQAPAITPAAQADQNHSAVLDADYQPSLSPAQQFAAAWQARAKVELTAKEAPRTTPPLWYTVQPGDTLSSIAARYYHNSSAWPVLYWRNHGQVHWADIIKIGQVLRVPAEPARLPAAPGELGPPAPQPVHTTAAVRQPQHAAPAPAAAPDEQKPAWTPKHAAPISTASTGTWTGSGWPGGAFGECVVNRESGGNPDVWNASGHWGLYQFSASTWVAYGGNPADFGSASVAEQERVFLTALASPGGEDNWAPYDGC